MPGEQCLGGIGAGCKGTGLAPPYPGPYSVERFVRMDGQEMHYVDMAVAVGAIIHDRSCFGPGYVAYCVKGAPDEESAQMEATCDASNEDCSGVREWWKAWDNVVDGRYWRYRFGPYPGTGLEGSADNGWQDDTRIVASRDTATSYKRGVLPHLGEKARNYHYSNGELAATKVLFAPAGTVIDYPDVAFCAPGLRGGTAEYHLLTATSRTCTSEGTGSVGGGGTGAGPYHQQ